MPTFTGTTGNDNLTGGDDEDLILGLEGNDQLHTGGVLAVMPWTERPVILPASNVRDVLRGGDGNDTLTADGVSNGSILYGDADDDRITVGFSGFVQMRSLGLARVPDYTAIDGDPVQIFGGTGDDVITAFSHAIIDGGEGNDTIRVGPGLLVAVFGSAYNVPIGYDTTVRVTGGAGADVFRISNPVGTAVITDFEVGVDRLNLVDSGYSMVDMNGRVLLGRQGADTLLMSPNGTVYARLLNVDPGSLGASTFLDNVNFEVTPGRPSTYLDLAGPIFNVGTDAAETIQGVGATFWYGAGGNDVLRAGTGNSILNGDYGDDVLIGNVGTDTLNGGAGADTLQGGAGTDVLSGGGSGRNVFRYTAYADSNAQTGSDLIIDFQDRYSAGNGGPADLIDLTAVAVNNLTLMRTSSFSTIIFATTGEGTLQIGSTGRVGGEDILTSGLSGVTVIGYDGNELLIAGAGADVIYGLGGSDTMVGREGADVLFGGAGIDRFSYWSAADSTASAYDTIVDFETGVDVISFGIITPNSIFGVDTVSIVRSAGSSFVFATSQTGNLQLVALGRDVNGSDIGGVGFLSGVYMIGSAANDVLVGSRLADPIQGGAGNDTITGGGGADVLFGEGGADTFVYVAASDSTVAAADTVFGFVSGQDRIDLTAVRTGSSDAFGIAYLNGGSYLFVDLGGNGSNDMLIQLAGTMLVASDIRWSTTAGELEPGVKEAGPEVLTVSDEADFGSSWLDTINDGGMLFLADAAPAPAHGPDWYL